MDRDALLAYDALVAPGDHDLGEVVGGRAGYVAQADAFLAGAADLLDAFDEGVGGLVDGAVVGRRDVGGRAGGFAGQGEEPSGAVPVDGDDGRRGAAGAGPAGDAVGGDAQQLEPGGGGRAVQRQGALLKREVVVGRLAAGGAGTAAGAVQDEVETGRGEAGEGVDVAEGAGAAGGVLGAAAAGERVAQRADAQPALLLVAAQCLGEPGGLVAAEEAVLVVGAVAGGDGGVEPGDDGVEFGDREEGPGLVAVEDGVQSLVEAAEQAGVVAPLGPVRRLGRDLVGLAGVEVPAAGGLADVLVPGDDDDALRRQVELGAQPGEEAERLVALAGAAGGGEVAGDDEEVGRGGAGVLQLDEVAADLPAQRVRFAAAAEVRAGEVQDGQRALVAGSTASPLPMAPARPAAMVVLLDRLTHDFPRRP
ncbi:hypothetical protein ABT168_15110, partial [Streptomyces sp. NPDC001793]